MPPRRIADAGRTTFNLSAALIDSAGGAGTPHGTSRQLTQTRAGSLIPSIHPWRTGFVLGWNEYEGTSDHAPRGRSQVLLRMIP